MATQTTDIELLALERGAIILLAQNLNNTISARATGWAAEDAAFYSAFGHANPNISVETISSENFYPGHNPSLIDAPIDRYPNVAAMAMRAEVMPSTDDWAEQYRIGLAIEVMCKAQCTSDTPDQTADALAAEIVNVRVKRTVEAIHAVLKTDNGRSFGRVVPKVGNAPTVITTDVFVRHEEKGRGPRWFWQGARIDYAAQQWVNYG